MAGLNVKTVTKQNFESEVLSSDKPVLVDFWASWCGPCRMIGPFIDELADEYVGKAVVGKVNVDEEGELAQNFRVMSIPTLMVFKNGKVVESIMGARPKDDLKRILDKHL